MADSSRSHRRTRAAAVLGGAALLLGGVGVPQAGAAPTAGYPVKIQLTHVDHVAPEIRVWDRATWKAYEVTVPEGEDFGTAELPSGNYLTIGNHGGYDASGTQARFLPKTFSVGTAATTVTLDANLAQPAAVTVDEPTAARVVADAWYTLPNGEAAFFANGSGATVYAAPVTLPGLTLNLHDVRQKRGSGPNRPSPYRYDLLHRFTGGTPSSPVVSVPTAGLAKKRTTVRAQGAGLSATVWTAAVADAEKGLSGTYLPAAVPLGTAYTHYLTPGASFDRYLEYGPHALGMPGMTLPAGDAGSEYFGRAPFTSYASQFPASQYAGGKFSLNEPASLSDAYGNEGLDSGGGTTWRVTGDGGALLGASGVLSPYDTYTVAAGGHSTYRITHTVTRSGAHSRLSPRVATEWTFPGSALTASAPLPVTDPRLTVSGLDGRNRVAAGPVTVGATLVPRTDGTTATLTGIESSTNDGATWTAAPLTASGATGSATVAVPAGAAFVSLRITGTDSAGGALRQTITRAFGGPAPQTGLKLGTTTIGTAVVNEGKTLVPTLTGLGGYSAAFTASDPSGIASAGVYLYHGPYDKPDGIVHVTAPADCVKRAGSTTWDCTAGFDLSGRNHLGLNKLAGTWSVAAWALAADGKGLFSGPVAGTATIKRASFLTANATPEPVTAGAKVTVKGTLTGSAWEYGAATALPSQKVDLQFRKSGSTTWTTVGSGTTDAGGAVTVSATATVDGGWRFKYAGTSTSASKSSSTDYVDVT
ncbi:hypothetical protein ACIQUQ_14680 [Streptomyces sp. NPDC101118]|uniref:hypothetical protein n=1 Tax=Streptomyces sp. NPDC101118 TaxID=3366109 RepID=UPI00380EEC77